MTCPKAWNLVQMFESKSGSCQECCPIQASQTYTPVCHLTSQWSGRLRAAHCGAAHRRVRCQIEISEFRPSSGGYERQRLCLMRRQRLEGPLQCASLFASLESGLSRWQRSADVLYINEALAQGADAVQRGAAPSRLDDLAPPEAETARASGNARSPGSKWVAPVLG